MDKLSYVYKAAKFNTSFWITTYWYRVDPDKKDDISGMSIRDILNVQKSWSVVYDNASASGILVFQRLFKADPETQKFFKYVAEATNEELASSPMFKAHVVTIMSSLNNAVNNLPQPEIVVPLMLKLGESHNARQIRKKHFWLFRDVMLEIVKIDLQFGDDTVASWKLFLEFMNQHILSKIPV